MVNPLNGYSPTARPAIYTPDVGLQPAAKTGTPAPASPAAQVASTPQTGVAAPGGVSRPNAALLEAMQASRNTSALLTSLTGPDGSFFPIRSPFATMPQNPNGSVRPNAALLEAFQAGRQSAALFGGLAGPGESQNALAIMRAPNNASQVNLQATLTRAGEIIRATESGQPSIANSNIASDAYLMEIQAQQQAQQPTIGGNWMHEWFA